MKASCLENVLRWSPQLPKLAFLSFLFFARRIVSSSQGHTLSNRHPSLMFASSIRGGDISNGGEQDYNSAFQYLADFVADKFPDTSREKLTKTLERMAVAQQTFKGLDGAAHEAYQRTKGSTYTSGGGDIDTFVLGRAQRSAARLAATAQGLLACELVEMVEFPTISTISIEKDNDDHDDTVCHREVLLNLTFSESNVKLGHSNLAVLVLYEASYDDGAGLDHGTILSLVESSSPGGGRSPKGRLLVVLGDTASNDLGELLSILNQKPTRLKLSSGLVREEVASVQPTLYKAASDLLKEVEPHLRKYNTTAIHFVGRSLAGGVASLAATILDGTIPLSKSRAEKKKKKKLKEPTELAEDVLVANKGNETAEPEIVPLNGLGRARSSALTLGAPPCLSSNVLAAFCTSFLYGDDLVVRTTRDSIDRLCDRIQRNLKGGFVGRNIGWMSDTLSLTVSSLQSHAHGSEGEEANLSVPGRAYLVRPRRLGGLCSIHEVGNLNKGGREALRANLFWQLHDVLLSKSMWRHHKLESYIHGLDRVQLRGITDETEEETMY